MKWIRTCDALPDAYRDVIVATREGKTRVMHMTTGGYWYGGGRLEPPGFVTAWQPLPEPFRGADAKAPKHSPQSAREAVIAAIEALEWFYPLDAILPLYDVLRAIDEGEE